MYQPGDIVVYRHRVCEVAAIREAYFEGRDYYELHALFENHLKLFVAVDANEATGVRSVMDRDRALALIDSIAATTPIDEASLASASDTAALRGRRMREEYERLLKGGDPEDLVPIIKSVHEHAVERERSGRQVTAVDKKYFDMAERMLFDELSVALDIDRDGVRDFVVARLEGR